MTAVMRRTAIDRIRPEIRFAPDSPPEEDGFEPSVPLLRKALLGVANRRRRHERRSHLQVQVRKRQCLREWLPTAFPFAEGPRVRIRLPPAESRPRTGADPCFGILRMLKWPAQRTHVRSHSTVARTITRRSWHTALRQHGQNKTSQRGRTHVPNDGRLRSTYFLLPTTSVLSEPIDGDRISTTSPGLRKRSGAEVLSGNNSLESAAVPAAVPPLMTSPG